MHQKTKLVKFIYKINMNQKANFKYIRYEVWIQNSKFKERQTCTGVAAVKSPATPPPKTRPSDPASDTLKPPVRLR